MRVADAAVLLALGVMVATAWLAAVGLVRARDVFGRLHYDGPVALLGPACLAAAFGLSHGPASPTAVRAGLVALVLATTGPVVAHATARAARLRARGTLEVRPGDAGAPR